MPKNWFNILNIFTLYFDVKFPSLNIISHWLISLFNWDLRTRKTRVCQVLAHTPKSYTTDNYKFNLFWTNTSFWKYHASFACQASLMHNIAHSTDCCPLPYDHCSIVPWSSPLQIPNPTILQSSLASCGSRNFLMDTQITFIVNWEFGKRSLKSWSTPCTTSLLCFHGGTASHFSIHL